MATDVRAIAAPSSACRWLQLVFSIACMMMIADLRYRSTLFVLPIDAKDHRDRAAIQLAFSIEAAPWATAKAGRRR